MEYSVSITRACRIMCFHKSLYYYRSRRDDSEVEAGIRAAAEYGDGFWKIYNRLRREGKPWNHKKVYRVIPEDAHEQEVETAQTSASKSEVAFADT